MVLLVTVPVEEAVRRVPGVQGVRSRTSRGSAEISINFDWGVDMASATLQVNAAIAQILPTLPAGIRMITRRMDPTVFPIIAYSLTSPARPLTMLYDLAEYQLRPLLSAVPGVARVQVVGGALEEYRVSVDPARLQVYGLTLADVARALSGANVLTAVGRLEDHYKLYLAIADSRLRDPGEIESTVLRGGPSGLVHVRDVATVERSTVPRWIRVNADGSDAVLFNIYQQPGGNSVQIATDIKSKLEAYRAQIPSDVRVANWYDQSRLVVASAASVRDAILIGTGLAALVLFAFLRNWKITLIAVIVVPTVLSATVVLLAWLDMSFNIMTLGGMAAAVGLIIDDAIVLIEHIVRRLRRGAGARLVVVMAATAEFTRPLAGSSAATLVIFAPLAFLSGVTGAFFKALSVTMAAGLFLSFLVTWVAVPILAQRFLNERDANQREGGRVTDWLHTCYGWLLSKLLDHPLYLLAGVLPLVALGSLAYQQVGSGFMPALDEGGFVLDYRSPPGTALSETDRLVRQAEQIIKATPEVDTYSRRTGLGLGGGLSEANEGDFFIRLKPPPRRPIEEVMSDIRGRIEANVPGLSIEMAQLMEDLIGDLTAVPQPVEVKIFLDDPGQLEALAEKTAAAIGKIAGVVDVRSGITPAGDALEIRIDKVKTALEGMDADGVSRSVADYIAGMVTTQIQSGPKMIGVRVWTPEDVRRTERDLGALQVRAPDGHLFPLRRVAAIAPLIGQPQITRENLKRMVAVTGRISGRDLGSVIRDVKQVLSGPGGLPASVYWELGGLYRQQQIAFRGLLQVFAAAVGLVFVLLLFMYERFRVAISIMAMPLLSISAVFIGLWVAGIELNISAMMGMTMIVGIVTEVAIFYFSEYHALTANDAMEHRRALIEAGKNRMRPIAMTTFAAILTLLPLALSIGQGSGMQQPLAVAIISGLLVQLPLVLLGMPAVFDVLNRRRAHRLDGIARASEDDGIGEERQN